MASMSSDTDAAAAVPAAPAAPATPLLYDPPSYRHFGVSPPAVPRPVSAVKFSPDGRWLAAGAADAALRIYRVCNEGTPIVPPPPAPVPSADPAVAVPAAASGSASASASAPAAAPAPPPLVSPIHPSLVLYAELPAAHELGINDLAFTPDSAYLLTASDDKLIHAWDLRAAKAHADAAATAGPNAAAAAAAAAPAVVPCIKTFKGHSSYVFCLSISHSGNLVASGGYDESLRLWDLKSARVLRTIRAHSDPISAVDFNRDGSFVVSSSYDGLCRIWETSTGRCLKTIYQDATPPVSHVRFSPNGKFILVSTLDSTLRLWELTKRDQCIKAYGGWKRGEGTIEAAAAASAATTMDSEEKSAAAAGSTIVSVVAPSASVSSLGDYVNTSLCIGASFITLHSRQLIVAGSEDGCIVLWDVIKQARVDTLVVPAAATGKAAGTGAGAGAEAPKRAAVLCVAVHPTLPILASASMEAPFGVTLWAHQQQ